VFQVRVFVVARRHAFRVKGRERHSQMLARVCQVVTHRLQIIRSGTLGVYPHLAANPSPKLRASSLSEEPSERAHSHDAPAYLPSHCMPHR
jgi:hypothetical protein